MDPLIPAQRIAEPFLLRVAKNGLHVTADVRLADSGIERRQEDYSRNLLDKRFIPKVDIEIAIRGEFSFRRSGKGHLSQLPKDPFRQGGIHLREAPGLTKRSHSAPGRRHSGSLLNDACVNLRRARMANP